ncbi:helix-turn-helix transcriptional regulator, partial [Lacticaseibacillus paracasei]
MSDLSLGSRLKQLRKARGMTQSQLADDLFVSRKTVSSWETGRNQP